MLANAMGWVSKDRQHSTAFMCAAKRFCNKAGRSALCCLLAIPAFICPGEGVAFSLRENLENKLKKVRSSLSVPEPALGLGLGVFLPAPVLSVLLVYRYNSS